MRFDKVKSLHKEELLAMQDYTHIVHPFEPIFNADSEVLALGSLPSVKSRENDFYYGHPQNRFWRVLAIVFGAAVPNSIPEKKNFLLTHHLALWDVIYSCDIVGSSDSSIKNAVPNNIENILAAAKIKTIIANGNTAFSLYKRFWGDKIHIKTIKMPSTSPANATWTLEKLAEEWRKAF